MLPARKNDHIRINLEEDVRSGLTTGLDRYHFIHHALPELDFNQVDPSQMLFGRKLVAPILISSMTGGTSEAYEINRVLALAAQETGVAMGLGSQRAALEKPDLAYTFQIRKFAPDILLFANLGAIQLNYGYSVDHCKRAVEMVQADGLILHLNPLQEVLQPEGDTRFAGLLKRIEQVCRRVDFPVVVKEVGFGIDGATAKLLFEAGVSVVDVAGTGGTSWSQVEMYRNHDEHLRRVASSFRDWGIPTAEAIQQVKKAFPGGLIFASGGLRNGVDIARCVGLGAVLGGMAGRFLKAAVISLKETVSTIQEIEREIKICMFLISAKRLDNLQNTKSLVERS